MDIKLKNNKILRNASFSMLFLGITILPILFNLGHFKKHASPEMFSIVIAVILGSFICIIATNKQSENIEENFIFIVWNKIYIEFKVLILIIMGGFADQYYKWYFPYDTVDFSYIKNLIFVALFYGLVYISIVNIKNNVKNNKKIINNSLTKKLYKRFSSSSVGVITVKSTAIHVSFFGIATMIFIILACNLDNHMPEFEIFLLATYCIGYVIFLVWYIIKISKYINELILASRSILKGEFNVDIPKNAPKLLREIGENLNNINLGFENAVEKAVKSEKMKSELITNVSHDLKTPLTSIINYVDLLKDEDLGDEERRDYINILDKKSQRLKVLIEDLFEAAKVTSGEVSLNLENLDVVALLRQTIGEFREKLTAASLELKAKIPNEKVYLNIDGKKTWRIFENLLTNILKYSLKNSRVYIELINNPDEVVISMKNISAFELDFDETEIIERFKRGDKARNTEGSGLGLAIAKSLVEIQGGSFNIDIDGDLFKAIIVFKK